MRELKAGQTWVVMIGDESDVEIVMLFPAPDDAPPGENLYIGRMGREKEPLDPDEVRFIQEIVIPDYLQMM